MTVRLEGRWEKFDRGRKHLERLKRQVHAFIEHPDGEFIGLRQEYEPHTKSLLYTVAWVREMPRDWGPVVGEIVHHLRSALDNLVWDLSLLDGKKVPLTKKGLPARTQFPICRKRETFEDANVQTVQLAGINKEHRALIEKAQPYNGVDEPWFWHGRHPLIALDELSNADKHRVLHPVLFGNAEIAMKIPPKKEWQHCRVRWVTQYETLNRPMEPGTKILRLEVDPIPTGDPRVDVGFRAGMYVALADGSAVLETLREIAEYVARTLEGFDDDLGSPHAIAVRKAIEERSKIADEVFERASLFDLMTRNLVDMETGEPWVPPWKETPGS